MTNEELKKKIVEILEEYNFETDDGEGWVLDTEEMADALIAAGIGDVSGWKRKAEVAERNDKLKEKALNNACAMLYAQGVESPFSDEDWHLLQAEKELAEGRKDEQN